MDNEATGAGKKKQLAFNVVSTKDHKGFGAGSIDLNNVSSVIIDQGEAYIDIGAMHAKSKIERGIKFLPNKDDVPAGGRQCWIVWVAVDRGETGSYYAGATACEMIVNPEARRGWKILADHVNKLDYALKRRYMLSELGEDDKAALKKLLIEHNAEWWENSPAALKEALS